MPLNLRPTIVTLKVALVSGPHTTDKWQGLIEIETSSTLHDLHLAIQHALSFDDDHLYEFYSARTERSRERITFDSQNDALNETSIESLFPLPKNRSLYYLFDYGDNWTFKVTKAIAPMLQLNADHSYPRLVQEVGAKPEQYPTGDEY